MMMKKYILKAATISLVVSICFACSSTVNDGSAISDRIKAENGNTVFSGAASLYLRRGLDALNAGNTDTAIAEFNKALKFSPENPHIHFLNAFAYHLSWLSGNPGHKELAETGYLTALSLDPDHALSAYQLGRFYLENRRFKNARDRLAQALVLDGDSVMLPSIDPRFALAIASYYAHDLQMAVWAIREAERRYPKDPVILRAVAIIEASANNTDRVESARERFNSLEKGEASKVELRRRLSQWSEFYAQIRPVANDDGAILDPETLKNTTQPTGTAAETPFATSAEQPKKQSAPEQSAEKKDSPVSPNWGDCSNQTTNLTSAISTAVSGNADETMILPPLPSPCYGRQLPRMAIIDAAIIRSQDYISSSQGINLLSSLQLVFSGSLEQATNDKGIFALAKKRGVSTPAEGITYALNIANSVDQRNEVLARPSLVALDRQPSTFFAGANLAMAVQGDRGGSKVEHPIGVSLSVVPTFIDDDSMLLSVKATRSFFEGDERKLENTVQTSRNSVLANVRIRFDQTLILSGLSERESQDLENGVPFLKDIPVAQYVFKSKTSSNFNNSVIITLTPRRPITSDMPGFDTQMSGQDDENVKLLRKRASHGYNPVPNLAAVIHNLKSHHLFQQFRNGDLKIEDWRRPIYIKRVFDQLLNILYF